MSGPIHALTRAITSALLARAGGSAAAGVDIQTLLRDLLLDNVDLSKCVGVDAIARAQGRPVATASRQGLMAAPHRRRRGDHVGELTLAAVCRAKKLQIAAEQAEQAAQFTSAQQFGLGVGLGTVRRGTISRAKDKGQVLMPSVPAGDFGSILYIYGSW